MLNWLRNRLMNRRRKIFTYWDGCKNVSVDPLLVWRMILGHPQFNPEVHGPAYDRGDEDAWRVVQKCARDVFQVPVYSGMGKPGLTELELDSLFKRFMLYMDGLKKSTKTNPTTPSFTQPEIPSTHYTAPTSLLSDLPSMPSENASGLPGCC